MAPTRCPDQQQQQWGKQPLPKAACHQPAPALGEPNTPAAPPTPMPAGGSSSANARSELGCCSSSAASPCCGSPRAARSLDDIRHGAAAPALLCGPLTSADVVRMGSGGCSGGSYTPGGLPLASSLSDLLISLAAIRTSAPVQVVRSPPDRSRSGRRAGGYSDHNDKQAQAPVPPHTREQEEEGQAAAFSWSFQQQLLSMPSSPGGACSPLGAPDGSPVRAGSGGAASAAVQAATCDALLAAAALPLPGLGLRLPASALRQLQPAPPVFLPPSGDSPSPFAAFAGLPLPDWEYDEAELQPAPAALVVPPPQGLRLPALQLRAPGAAPLHAAALPASPYGSPPAGSSPASSCASSSACSDSGFFRTRASLELDGPHDLFGYGHLQEQREERSERLLRVRGSSSAFGEASSGSSAAAAAGWGEERGGAATSGEFAAGAGQPGRLPRVDSGGSSSAGTVVCAASTASHPSSAGRSLCQESLAMLSGLNASVSGSEAGVLTTPTHAACSGAAGLPPAPRLPHVRTGTGVPPSPAPGSARRVELLTSPRIVGFDCTTPMSLRAGSWRSDAGLLAGEGGSSGGSTPMRQPPSPGLLQQAFAGLHGGVPRRRSRTIGSSRSFVELAAAIAVAGAPQGLRIQPAVGSCVSGVVPQGGSHLAMLGGVPLALPATATVYAPAAALAAVHDAASQAGSGAPRGGGARGKAAAGGQLLSMARSRSLPCLLQGRPPSALSAALARQAPVSSAAGGAAPLVQLHRAGGAPSLQQAGRDKPRLLPLSPARAAGRVPHAYSVQRLEWQGAHDSSCDESPRHPAGRLGCGRSPSSRWA